jgi:tetratricopeptide (TPR) repeat protein
MRSLFLTLVLAATSWVAAATLLVHPFQAHDVSLGAVLADRIAEALGPDVVGPAATPALVVPLVAPTGFVNPVPFVDDPGLAGRNGVWLLRGVSGADAALSGTLRAEADDLVLRLELDHRGRARRAVLRGDLADPGELAGRAAALVGRWLDRPVAPQGALDMAGADGALGRALSLVAAGLPRDALAALDQAAAEGPLPARLEALARSIREALEAVDLEREAVDLDDLAVRAVVSLNLGDLAAAETAFTDLAAAGLPVGHAWSGAIAYNEGDLDAAEAAFDRAAGSFDVGLAARAAFLDAIGAPERAAADLRRVLERADASAAALLLASLAAGLADRPVEEDALLARLEGLAPFLTYVFERRSFLAFEADDALGAAQALAVALELDDQSDLYWTNYGWALYLLDRLAASEAASRRALELDPAQFIARYNLGLVEVVTDRLDAALASYREALRYDPRVDPEVVADLVDAETRYPAAAGVPFALATLLEARGERDAAAAAFERYAALVAARPDLPGADPARAREATERAALLRAPLPPITITGDLEVRLGRHGPALTAAQPGDPLVISFEVTTAGDALPRLLHLEARLEDGGGGVIASAQGEVDVPSGAIGYVVDVARLELPESLPSGRYTLVAEAAGEGLAAEAVRTVEVEGEPELVRRLVGRDVGLLALETEQPLLAPRDATQPDVFMTRLVWELRDAAGVAEEVLPRAERGRFAGVSGGEVFDTSSEDDVRDFLRYVLAEGAADTSFTFVDGYAEWVLQGAP